METTGSKAPGRFEGRVAVVTGAASGIGRSTARLLAAEGASVLVADIDAEGAEAVAAGIVARGGVARSHPVDVADEEGVAATVGAAVENFGRLDVLHNNAAALGADVLGRDRGIVDLDVDVWDRTMAVNARGVLLGCKHAIPRMLANGDGRGGVIVNTSSVAAWAAATTKAAYGASKAAVESLTAYVATMYGKQGIRCNAVALGLVLTEAAQARLSDNQLQRFRDVQLTPDVADPDDIARVVAFLASDDATHMTGHTVMVDGGMFAHSPLYRP